MKRHKSPSTHPCNVLRNLTKYGCAHAYRGEAGFRAKPDAAVTSRRHVRRSVDAKAEASERRRTCDGVVSERSRIIHGHGVSLIIAAT